MKSLLSAAFPVGLNWARGAEKQMIRPKVKPVYRVMGWDAARLVWTVRSIHDDENDAAEHAEALWWSQSRLRVMVLCGTVRIFVFQDPPICNVSRQFREEQAMRMSDLADAKKYYKSPG